MTLGAGFVRVSTGSQDETSQVRMITQKALELGITIVRWFTLHGYSASAGEQEPALREAIADIQRGDYTTLVVTDSSRLDRRENIWAQLEIIMAIRLAGGEIVSIAEPTFGKDDFGALITTVVAQKGNADKSKTVKSHSYRGITVIRDNKAHSGALPTFWATRGERKAKQAYCANPRAVTDIYERVARGESIAALAREYHLYPQSIRNLIQFTAHHTGVIQCSYTFEGQTDTWAHKVTPVVESALWWRANNVLQANKTTFRNNRGGRPVAEARWLSGLFDCPGCGGRLYLNTGTTRAGNPATPKLRCGGLLKSRIQCGKFKACDAQPIADAVEAMFSADETPILTFQRVTGNAHELDELKAALSKIQARLSATEDDSELDKLVAERKALKASIEAFKVTPDSFDYAPTGQTIAGMWAEGGDTKKRGMVRAIKDAGAITLVPQGDGTWGVRAMMLARRAGAPIIDLGSGLCFRSEETSIIGEAVAALEGVAA